MPAAVAQLHHGYDSVSPIILAPKLKLLVCRNATRILVNRLPATRIVVEMKPKYAGLLRNLYCASATITIEMRGMLMGLLVASALFGQDTPFDRLKREATRTRTLTSEKEKHEPAIAVAALHAALRDWIEAQLPQRQGATADLSRLEATLQNSLWGSGLMEPDKPAPADIGPEGPGVGYVGFEFKMLPELLNSLFVIASVTVECGSDEAIYLYHFEDGGRTRVFEDHPKSKWGYTSATFELSGPDSKGRRLGGDDEPAFVLKPDELIIELRYFSTDAGIRTNIYRYNFKKGVQRLDPVALQPQDFAEEWLTRPWGEMQPRSAADTKKWHERLHADYVFGNYTAAIPCPNLDRWLVAMDIKTIGDKKLPDPLRAYFLLRDLGNFRYRVKAVAESRPVGCTDVGLSSDAGFASDGHPWLSTAELKALK
jgi:hypothetical protein